MDLKSPTAYKGWRCLQANVAHSKAATLELPTIESGDFDIFLIQEPYLIEGQVAGLPLGWCTILEENGSVLIAVNNPQLALLTRWISQYVVAVEVMDTKQRVTVVYFSPSRPKEIAVRDLDQILCTHILVGGDGIQTAFCGDRTSKAIGVLKRRSRL
ncbi:hypothetical protein CDAR_533191 [Caerostris darwini]|uniref:Uncharacterized protein n=1 Tax=Caerostris darwini TaxID=1538125 RepID=A0AAV4SDC5_9ARAC|nr:hypothetical protein CDAR_533191 [Caerostris darwini]